MYNRVIVVPDGYLVVALRVCAIEVVYIGNVVLSVVSLAVLLVVVLASAVALLMRVSEVNKFEFVWCKSCCVAFRLDIRLVKHLLQ